MEDAIELASNLKPYYSENIDLTTIPKQKLYQILSTYLKKRKKKVSIVQTSNYLIAAFGQVSKSSLIYIRNSIIHIIPNKLRNKFFNNLHRFYLG